MSRVGSPVDGDEVGEQARAPPRRPVVDAEDARIARRRRDQHVGRPHPQAAISSISRAFSPCGNTPTSPPTHIVTPPRARRRSWRACRYRLRLGRPTVPAAIVGDRVGGGERRAIAGAMLLHQAEDLGRAGIAMLDRVGAGEDGAAHPFRGAGMDRDLAAGGMGGLDRHFISSRVKVGRLGSPGRQR